MAGAFRRVWDRIQGSFRAAELSRLSNVLGDLAPLEMRFVGRTLWHTVLVGVSAGPESLALVETAEGIGYILKAGDTLGDGRVTEIGTDSVSFAVSPKPGEKAGTVTLRLRTD